MNSLSGFIKLFRKFKAWGWYQDYVVKDVFIHLLLSANFKAVPWNGRILEEGQVVTGTVQLAKELGFSRQQVRTALNKLKSTNEITTESTNRYTVVTIVNWRDYQSDTEALTNEITKIATNKQPTDNQQATNKQPRYKNVKNNKNVKNVKKREGALSPHGFFNNIFLTDNELAELSREYPNDYEKKIERLSRYIESHGDKYVNHFAVLMDWLAEDTAKSSATSKRKTSYDINEVCKIDTLDFIE